MQLNFWLNNSPPTLFHFFFLFWSPFIFIIQDMETFSAAVWMVTCVGYRSLFLLSMSWVVWCCLWQRALWWESSMRLIIFMNIFWELQVKIHTWPLNLTFRGPMPALFTRMLFQLPYLCTLKWQDTWTVSSGQPSLLDDWSLSRYHTASGRCICSSWTW